MSSPFDPNNIGRRPIGQDQTGILKECCESSAPAIILSLEEARTYYHAQLASVSDDLITLNLGRVLPRSPTIGASCWVSFNYRGDSGAFFSTVAAYYPEQSPAPALVLKLGSCIVGVEARMAYRVNVSPDSPLTVQVATRDGRTWDAKAIDMSVAGMLIDFGYQGTCPRLRIGARIDITLRLHSYEVSLKSEVRRQVGSAYGVFFLDVATDEGLLPPPALQHIVGALERDWLQGRIRPS